MKKTLVQKLLVKEQHAMELCRALYPRTSWVSGRLEKDNYGEKTIDYLYGRNYAIKMTIREILNEDIE